MCARKPEGVSPYSSARRFEKALPLKYRDGALPPVANRGSKNCWLILKSIHDFRAVSFIRARSTIGTHIFVATSNVITHLNQEE